MPRGAQSFVVDFTLAARSTGVEKFSSKTMSISDAVKHEITQICATPIEDIRDDASLAEYGLDSMRSMELIVALEARFKIQIHDGDIGVVPTVGDMVRAIERYPRA